MTSYRTSDFRAERADRQVTPLAFERATFACTTVAPCSWELNTHLPLPFVRLSAKSIGTRSGATSRRTTFRFAMEAGDSLDTRP
jgi:hypothetical protein